MILAKFSVSLLQQQLTIFKDTEEDEELDVRFEDVEDGLMCAPFFINFVPSGVWHPASSVDDVCPDLSQEVSSCPSCSFD